MIQRDLEEMHRQVACAPNDLRVATSAPQIREARRQGKIACFAGLEGAHGLHGRLEALPHFQSLGLNYVGLVHFTKSEAGYPMVGWGKSLTAGLTDFGRQLVDELNRLGLIVDVAHLNKPGVLEVCRRSRAPVICSHTACTAVYSSPRGIDDDQLRAIARTGGVLGVIFVRPFIGPGGVDAVVAHLNHIRDRVGVEHCAVGSDWEGWALYPDDLDSAEKMPALTEALLRAGWSPEEIQMAYGENFMRVLQDVQGAARVPTPTGSRV